MVGIPFSYLCGLLIALVGSIPSGPAFRPLTRFISFCSLCARLAEPPIPD